MAEPQRKSILRKRTMEEYSKENSDVLETEKPKKKLKREKKVQKHQEIKKVKEEKKVKKHQEVKKVTKETLEQNTLKKEIKKVKKVKKEIKKEESVQSKKALVTKESSTKKTI